MKFSEKKKRNINISNILFSAFFTNKYFYLFGFLLFRGKAADSIDKKKIRIMVGEKVYPIKFLTYSIIKIPIIRDLFNFYGMRVSLSKIVNLPINNLIRVIYIEEDGITYKKALRYAPIFVKPYHNKKVKRIVKYNSSVYLRQNAKNGIVLTVRKINVTDHFREQIKINIAYFLSKFKKHNKTLMYEKEASRYEESASIIFEKLIEGNYKNIYFIINKDNDNIKKYLQIAGNAFYIKTH